MHRSTAASPSIPTSSRSIEATQSASQASGAGASETGKLCSPPGEARGDLLDWLGASRLRFAIVASTALILPYNLRFWRESLEAVGDVAPQSLLFLASLALILITLHTLLLLILPGRRVPALVTSCLFMLAAIVATYGDAYGVFFDIAMIRNVFETDPAEVRDLITLPFVLDVVLLGIFPAAMLGQVKLPAESWRSRLAIVAGAFGGGLILSALLALSFSATLASFLREHKPLRYLINPANVIVGTARYVFAARTSERVVEYIEGPVERAPGSRGGKPLLVVMVVGETARAANFQLGGYERPTNPRLSQIPGVVYFRDVRSCGTSTATSVPCMFSHFGRQRFDLDAARAQSNLLDAVVRGGVDAQWLDNNSGCKHVCDRVWHVDYSSHPREGPCQNAHCFDEVLLERQREQLGDARQDTLVVLHLLGSHGPAYAERYPAAFEVFTPTCRSADLGQCERQAVVNAYDNSLRYTDYVLARQIDLLRTLDTKFDSLLLFVSDHGESLGERGIYLHAAPYFMAPKEQTHVPLVMWMSDGYRARAQLNDTCLRVRAAQPASHDDVYHTVLGSLGLRSAAYQRDRDLLSACRSAW